MRRLIRGLLLVPMLALSSAALGEGLDDFSAPPPEVTAPKPQPEPQPSQPAATSAPAPASTPSPPKPGSVFRDCAECPEMVVIPAGSFLMGSPAADPDRYNNEGPQHRVTIARPFALGKYEIAFAEWDACAAEGGCRHRPRDEGWGRGSRPVITVFWEDAQAYVRWLSQKTGKGYRLATEAEWEYAARAGTTTAYYWGAAIGRGHANCDGCGSQWDDRQTAPVGSFAPNGFGLYDMSGNVWEWVLDCYVDSYAGASASGAAQLVSGCDRRVVRGGSWGSKPRDLRAAIRFGYEPANRNINVGFRVARTY